MGAWLSSRLGATDALSALRSAGNSTVPEIGTIVSILTVLALVGTIGENGYSGALSLMTVFDSVKSIRPSVNWRIVGSLLMAAVSLAFGLWLLFSNKYLTALDDMLTIVLYLAAPWTAINLLDFFYIRRGRYAVTDLFDRDGIYGSWGTRALVSYFVALAAEVPFMLLSFYTGPAASAIGDVDISFAAGLLISGALYFILTRGQNRTLEESAIEASRTRLESASNDRERGLSVAPRLG
jgi:purine-cytosine permease-like protein